MALTARHEPGTRQLSGDAMGELVAMDFYIVIPFILISVIIAAPIAWFISEIKQASRYVRLTLGITTISLSFGVAFLVGLTDRLNSNAWFGSATEKLISTTITELESGHQTNVINAFKDLKDKYHPSYQDRSRYDELVNETIEQMSSSKQVNSP